MMQVQKGSMESFSSMLWLIEFVSFWVGSFILSSS